MKRIAVISILTSVIGYGFYAVVRDRRNDEIASSTVSVVPSSTPKPIVGSRQYVILLDVSTSRPEAMILQGQQFVHVVIDQMKS